ncbi:MAG: hypothetical protein ACO1RT_14440 [Planctomycetaceae bacterium]
MPIRSGRISRYRTVITGRANTFFRVLNAGEFNNSDINLNAFEIVFGNAMHDKVFLIPTFSIDFFATSDVAIAAGGSSAKSVVDGIYESLPSPEVKSGRFKTRAPMNPTVGVPIIITAARNAIYRIYNSGPVELQVVSTNRDGTDPTDIGEPLREGETFDFVTPNNKVVLVKGLGTAAQHIEGIYEFIGLS